MISSAMVCLVKTASLGPRKKPPRILRIRFGRRCFREIAWRSKERSILRRKELISNSITPLMRDHFQSNQQRTKIMNTKNETKVAVVPSDSSQSCCSAWWHTDRRPTPEEAEYYVIHDQFAIPCPNDQCGWTYESLWRLENDNLPWQTITEAIKLEAAGIVAPDPSSQNPRTES